MSDSGTLSKRTVAAFGLGHILNDLCASMWFNYLMIYFTNGVVTISILFQFTFNATILSQPESQNNG